MQLKDVYDFTQTIKDGESGKFTVNMLAPNEPGIYNTTWAIVSGSQNSLYYDRICDCDAEVSRGKIMKKKLLIFIPIAVLLVIVTACTPGSVAQINTPVPAQAGTPAPNDQINVPGVSIQVNAPGPNPLENKEDANQQVAGIGMGIWHGIISPVTLIISFSNPNVQMYEVYNDGSQYNFGFLVGVAIVFILLGVFAGSRRRR